jgi:selenide, water dikinase
MTEEIKLTEYSHGAGCGCKIAPNVLSEILHDDESAKHHEMLLVGNDSRDDAAVYDMGDGTATISTTDFFMPIVDDAFDFGRIASANAISDVYAMGGKPLMAIAILGWPIEKLPASLAKEVMKGCRQICEEAGIPLAGGHSIDSPEPIFGLAVTGTCKVENLKRNNTAKEGDLLFLTKALGVGVLTTAQKRKELQGEHVSGLLNNLTSLNKVGEQLGNVKGIHAMTDVTGFGLLGHAFEMAEGSGLSAEIFYNQLQVLPGVAEYIARRIVPDATFRNWNSYSAQVNFEPGVNVMEAFSLLPDPQTNGGLLIAIDEKGVEEMLGVFKNAGLSNHLLPVGRMTAFTGKRITVKNIDG